MATKYTKEMLAEAAKGSISIAQVLKKLGKKQGGGSHVHISKKLKYFNIDTSHFLGCVTNSGENHRGGPKKKHWSEVLIHRINSNYRSTAFKLRRALIEFGREYKCELCDLTDSWQGSEIRLEVDHKNNDWTDDRANNLRFLCPNCHSQQRHKMNQGRSELTSTAKYHRYRLRLKKGLPENHSFINNDRSKGLKRCLDCEKPIDRKATRCKSCAKKLQGTRIVWPTIDDLKEMLKESSYCTVARQLGVSDNAIRKRLKNYGHVA